MKINKDLKVKHMTIQDFKSSPTQPTDNLLLVALWHDYHGDWDAAYDISSFGLSL
jgi:hypothetical protein